MKYITPEIWASLNAKGTAVWSQANLQYARKLSRYERRVPGLARKLGHRQARFFINTTRYSLWPGRLLSFAVSDWPGGPGVGRKRPAATQVEMTVLAEYFFAGKRTAFIYRLRYTGVTEISINTKNDLFPLPDSRFGRHMNDELLPEKRGHFRHNILFQTGTEISIVFRVFRFERKKETPGKLRQYAWKKK